MKYGDLIEHNMRKIFPEKSCTKCGGESIPRPVLKNLNLAYLWINIYNLVLLYVPVEDYQNIC